MSATVLESFNSFLSKERGKVLYPDMIDRLLMPGMEIQINVAAEGGRPVEDKKGVWTNGQYEWWSIRVPKDANSDPHFKDYPLHWPIEVHTESIGTTGWNRMEKRSVFCGFDYDAITGHAAGVGVDAATLKEVREKAQQFPFVEVRRSTSGNGLHFFVHVEGFETENHTVHQALGRAILLEMSREAGFDFSHAVDACGSNMWHWSRRANAENKGFEFAVGR